VCEQGGTIRVIKNGSLLPVPFLTVTVDSFSEHGLLGIALDPAFNTNHYVYIYYTATTPVLHNRISRFTANGDTVVPGSELVIFELDTLVGELGWHQGGNIRFGPEGKLYVAVGDDRNGANSQLTNNLFGKILRINADGGIPEDNPFYSTLSGKNRAIWALGLRNPFSFAFQRLGGRLFINDVGEETWEEINDGIAGSNYGWPDTEGFTNDPRFRSPILVYGHGFEDETVGCAITGGAFYDPVVKQFPIEYHGDYFYMDFCQGWIRRVNPTNGPSELFGRFTYYPVDLKVGNDGALYYLERGIDATTEGAVHKIEYPNQLAPQITSHPSNVTVAEGQPATFTVAAAGAAPLNYQWQRGGVDIPGASSTTLSISSPSLADNGATFACVVSNANGSVVSNSATLTVVAGASPVGQIVAPSVGTYYQGGQSINYSGTASDSEDGQLPATAFTWYVDFHHDTHAHPFIPPTSGMKSGSFVIPTSGETAVDVWYRIHLTVTDSSGLTHTSFRDVVPTVETITIDTDPSGLNIKLDDQPQTSPLTFSSVVGVNRTITAVSPQQFGGVTYEFVSWSDGGSATHSINAGGTFIATYRAVQPGAGDIVLYASEGTKVGNYAVVNDGTAAGGARMFNADAGGAKLGNALGNPGSYFELSFNAEAGTAYRLWVRGRAQDDSPYNDSIFVQFSDSVSETGAAVNRIGTTSAEVINLEDCFACGLSGWGWQDNGWGTGVLGPLIYFANSGPHTIRIQVREDGLSLDQIVLSPATYLNNAPGAVINDATILPKSPGP
jgi:glucose/arabinose dehydrogenase